MKVGIIGYGYWGPNITRNFHELKGCSIKTVADVNVERLNLIQKQYPQINITTSADDVLNDTEIDAVAIVTPVSTHYDFAMKALNNGKHVLVEKPMAMTTEQAEKMLAFAERKNLVMMVDHTFIYTGAVEKIKSLIDGGEIGHIQYIDSTRINLGLFQQDVNVLWDLAAHDISIINYLIEERPVGIQAIGASHTYNNIENIAYLFLHYESGIIVHLNCSWSSPVKIRTMLVGGDKKMIVYNDIEPTDKVKIYDRGYTVNSEEDKRNALVDYRLGDVTIPKIATREALAGVVEDFYNAIYHQKTPRANAYEGLEVVRILELANESLRENGKHIYLNPVY